MFNYLNPFSSPWALARHARNFTHDGYGKFPRYLPNSDIVINWFKVLIYGISSTIIFLLCYYFKYG